MTSRGIFQQQGKKKKKISKIKPEQDFQLVIEKWVIWECCNICQGFEIDDEVDVELNWKITTHVQCAKCSGMYPMAQFYWVFYKIVLEYIA